MDINKTVTGQIGVFKNMIVSGPVIIQMRDGVEKTLLVKHGDKPIEELKWKFCGGRVLKGMNPEENAVREAKEEIGVEVKLVKPLKPMIIWNEVPEVDSEQPEAIILIHYLATISEEPIKDKKALSIEWFDINNLPDDCAPNIKPMIQNYLDLK